jgi:DNA adenine methylase
MNENIRISPAPFLRWAGSKKALIDYIKAYIPDQYNNYHEPFLGSGSVFFSLNKKDKTCYLSDVNKKLINTFIQIKYNIDSVCDKLRSYKNNSEYYYMVRNTESTDEVEEAARFIYINKVCYNGLYRVNRGGKFNVPYGKRKNVDIVSEPLLRSVSTYLENVIIENYDFEESLKYIKKGDLVFIDPPYVVSHYENGFVEYNQQIFSWSDQVRLHDYILEVQNKSAYFIMTNAAHSSISTLYADIGNPSIIKRLSKIGGKSSFRGMVNEYLFTNTIKTV